MAYHHDVVQRVLWLKTKLSSNPLPEIAKIIRLLHKLSRLPVDVEVLQETGIGKCVNGLKKRCPEISVYVKPLIQSWKAVVQRAMLAEAEQKQSESALENGNRESKDEEEEAASLGSPSNSPIPGAEAPSPASGRSSPDQKEDQNHFSDGSDVEKEQPYDSPSPVRWTSGMETFDSYDPKHERQKTSPYLQEKSRKSHQSTLKESPPKKQKVSHKFESRNEDMSESKKEKYSIPGSTFQQRTDEMDSQRGKKSHNISSSRSHNKYDPKRSSSPKHHHDSRKSNEKLTQSKPALSDPYATYSQDSNNRTSEPLASNVLLNEKKVFSKSGKVSKDGPKSKSWSEHSSVNKAKKSLPKGANMDDSGMLFQPDLSKSEKKISPSSKKPSGHRLEKTNKMKDVARIEKTGSSGEERDSDLHKVNKKKKQLNSEPTRNMSSEERVEKQMAHSGKRQSSSSKHKHESDTKASKSGALVSRKSSSGQHGNKSISDKGKPSKSASIKPPPLPSDDENEPEERTFENTGMSFEDCLFGGSLPKVVKKSKPSPSNSIKSSSSSHHKTSNDDRKAVKISESKEKLKTSVKEQSHSKTQHDRERKKSSKRKLDEGKNLKDSVKKVKDSQQKSEELREASASEVDLSLPDIQPDYKPLRLPDIKPSDRRKAPQDPEVSSMWFGSKQTKTKVYSGKARKRHWEHVPSLQDICKEVIFDNIDALYETGGVPFYLMKDILEKCTAQQLLKIEDYNPDYMLESDYLWKRHVEKTFKGCEPDEMESWKDLYVRKSDEREYKLLAITANISAGMAKKETGRLTKLAFVDRPVKPPRNVIRQQIRHGTSTSSSPAKAPKPKKPIPGESSSSHRVVPNREAAPLVHRQKTAKVVAPMMQKSLKLMKRVTSRR